ncbi:hypothetical protein H9Q09_21120 [Aurantimonas sp. DM33-3]|uniref:DUF7946 domain-containing protein n=1 Tax=Aurantimonas sp. DM33-3 TaxID=2766955 RepID=UPI0016529487|nr:hypothetical protein [Aurantimonas sp. DM33-3]MBC6718687.1 hypothetical protein [Aurantimonas sp. DM33-3]
MKIDFIVKFEGDLADSHRIPAYDGTSSLHGITRSILIPANYLVEGRVRKRRFEPTDMQLNVIATRPGSFETVYELIVNPAGMAILAGIGIATSDSIKAFTKDFIQSVIDRATGRRAKETIEQKELTGAINPGDLNALVEAVEPALKEAHRTISRGATQILIIQGDNNTIRLDSETKQYVNSTIEEDTLRAKIVSVAGYYTTSRYGRAFDFEEGRTIPFELNTDADRETVEAIFQSMRDYAFSRLGDDLRSAIAIKYRALVSTDGRLKKMKVLKARREISNL